MSFPSDTIVQGDSLEVLRTLPDGLVQLCVTSPPYWGLREYRADGKPLPGQWGREATMDAHVARLVEWGREVRRVLRPDGVLMLNYGESYAANRTRGSYGDQSKHGYSPHGEERLVPPELKAKDLLGLPWEIARAFRADGWYWRAWWPWVKLNGMPESCRDRPALSIETMLMFTPAPRYFWDQDAIRVGYASATIERADGSAVTTGNPDVRPGFRRMLSYTPVTPRTNKGVARAKGVGVYRPNSKETGGVGSDPAHGRIRKTGDWHRESVALAAEQARAWADHAEDVLAHGGALLDLDGLPLGQLHATFAYPGSHFATFPPNLVRPVIRAATSERGQCPACRAPWVRSIETHRNGTDWKNGRDGMVSGRSAKGGKPTYDNPTTTGWAPSCGCAAGEPVPQIVLDPFAGTGTTCVVAAEEGRRSLGIDLYGGEYDFGGHTAMDRLRAALGSGAPVERIRCEREDGQLRLIE